MPRTIINPNKLFYQDMQRLIQNLLINNPNYTNGHYYKDGVYASVSEFKRDTIERAGYILERMESEKHLIDL